MIFSTFSFFAVRLRDHLYWVFRRANAGFVSGVIAWFFIPMLSRVISQDSTAVWHFCIQGLLGGAFLGTVDGMVEESSPKTIRGALLGGAGGAIGGALFGYYNTRFSPEQIAYGIFGFWGLAGAGIGLVSALWERSWKKILAGGLSGMIGGGLGGWLGYAVFAYLDAEFHPQGWAIRRLCEGFTGGLIGVTLWFAIGLAERFVIFSRRPVEGKSYKGCDHCDTQCPLNSWYCAKCGSVLQQSASPASLNLSPYSTLDRLKDMFKFLSRLAGTTGVIAGIVVFVVLLPVHKMLAFVAMVLVAIASYSLHLFFAAVSESIQIALKK